MKFLKFNSPIAGRNFAISPGDVVEWPDDEEAGRMIDRGIADELTPDAAEAAARAAGRPVRHRPVETATARKAPEKAVAR